MMSTQRSILTVLVSIGLCSSAHVFADSDLDYARDIAPVFRAYCAGCHNDEDEEGDFSLETYARLREGGDRGDPIAPGKPADSLLLKSLSGKDRLKMPPKDSPQVPKDAVELLNRWVEAGARKPSEDVSILQSLTTPQLDQPAELVPAVTSLSVSPDGSELAIGRFGRVEIRDSATYSLEQTLPGLSGKTHAVSFVGDDRIIVATGITGLSGSARLLNRVSGETIHEFRGHSDILYDAAVSPDGKTLATAGYDRRIRLWDLSKGDLLREIDVHKGAIFDLAFDPSGTVLASASADETVKLWRVADGQRLDTLNQPQAEQYAVQFSADGDYIVSAGADRRIHLWRFLSKTEPRLNPVVASRFAHEAAISALAILPDGRHLATAAEDKTLKIWSLSDLRELASYEIQSDVVTAFSPMERTGFIVARLDGTLESYALPRVFKDNAVGLAPAVARVEAAETAEPTKLKEAEPNHEPSQASRIDLPAEITGVVAEPGDQDVFRFRARAGEELTIEVNAARSKSKLDSKIEVLDADGESVEQVVLQAVRDSWFTFRGKDSDTSNDFRVHNWREMELNEYLFANGEVVRLWHYPRGPDSGFRVYPGTGKRQTSFSTSALSHPLGEPCYIVAPLPAGAQPAPNGLPVFRLNYENDDDPTRRRGSDSFLLFTAPRDGEYLARVTDVRGFGGDDYRYALTIRPRRPDFKLSIGGRSAKVSPGSGRELTFNLTRLEGFEGEVRVDIGGLPEGFSVTTPIVVEAGQNQARGVLFAEATAKTPTAEQTAAVTVKATATIQGREVSRDLGDLGAIQIGPEAKILVEILGAEEGQDRKRDAGPLVFSIKPGETIAARVRATRRGFGGRISLGSDDSGRNLGHGVYVDNIGLNGLLIVEGQTERDFFITAAPTATPSTRMFHLRAGEDGGQCSQAVVLRVVEAD